MIRVIESDTNERQNKPKGKRAQRQAARMMRKQQIEAYQREDVDAYTNAPAGVREAYEEAVRCGYIDPVDGWL